MGHNAAEQDPDSGQSGFAGIDRPLERQERAIFGVGRVAASIGTTGLDDGRRAAIMTWA